MTPDTFIDQAEVCKRLGNIGKGTLAKLMKAHPVLRPALQRPEYPKRVWKESAINRWIGTTTERKF